MKSINYKELQHIVNNAKRNYSNQSLPLYVSNTKIEFSELSAVSMVESIISFLNSKDLLKEEVNIEYTDINELESLD